ncbi:MFS transporter [Lentzea sp. NBRC 105346]|nr:MFS transporter [Lentzea sp. NBRC 105346]
MWERNFTLALVSTVISAFGTAAAPVASAFAIIDAGGAGSEIGLVSAAGMVPAVLFFLVGGVIADRLPRHRVMVGASLVSALAQALFAVAVLTHSVRLWELVVLAALNGLATAFAMPAAEGLLMQTVGREQASKAFAVFRTGLNVAQIAGAASGGLLVGFLGPGWVLVLDSATFVVAAALRALMRVEGNMRRREGMAVELRAGWSEFTGRRWLWSSVLQFAVVNALGVGAFAVLGAVAASQYLGGAKAWGLVLACDAAGMVLGGLIMIRLRPVRLLVSALSAVSLLALPLLALACGAPLLVVCASALLGGVGVEVFGVNWMTAQRQEIPQEMFSRIAAYEAVGSFGLAPLGAALAGPAGDRFGVGVVLGCSAIAIGVATALVLSVPEVRGVLRHRPVDQLSR